MTEKEWLLRIEGLEREQREHYAEGLGDRGDAVGQAIRFLVSEGRSLGFSLPDGRRPVVTEEQPKPRTYKRKPAP